MSKRILIILAHPDPAGGHLNNQLAEEYRKGADGAGHEVRVLDLAHLDFPLLQSKEDWEKLSPPESIARAQKDISWAEHIVFIYPLWMGTMPALLKGFLEQVARPGFALDETGGGWPKKLLHGKSARIIITMGMPAFIYRWFYRAHSLKNLERNILYFVGIKPVKSTLIGLADNLSEPRRAACFSKIKKLGSLGK